MRPLNIDDPIRIAWDVACDAAIAAAGVSLKDRNEKKTVYRPAILLVAKWNAVWNSAIELADDQLDKNDSGGTAPWKAAMISARAVLEKSKVNGLPPPAADQVIGDAAWAAVCCAVDNAEWNNIWQKALLTAKEELKKRDSVFKDDWDKSWADITKAALAIVEKNFSDDSSLSESGLIAWQAAWVAAGNAAWAATTNNDAGRISWHTAAMAAKASLRESLAEWDLVTPKK